MSLLANLHYLAAVLDRSKTEVPMGDFSSESIGNIIRIALGIAGAVAVFIVVLSAFRYIVSQGDPQSVAKAKNGIINALIGLAISILGISIVTFVLSRI